MSIKPIFLLFSIILFSHLTFSQNLPFSIAMEPVTIPSLPGVQSFAYGQSNGKWLIVSGRLDGLHKAMGMGMMGTPFPSSGNNNQIIVVDPASQQTWVESNSSLPTAINEQLSSTNTQFFQDGNYLYIVGGYGYQSAAGEHRTFDKLTAIDVPNVINAVVNGNSFSSFIRQIGHSNFQVTGGQLEKINDTYYLVGGHNFEGTYHHMNGMGMFTQTYTNQVRKFKIQDNGTTLSVTHLPAITDNINLHRRDYNLVAQIFPTGEEGLTAFSGVFQETEDIPYLNCVEIDSTGITANNAFAQYYNHYQCANFPFFSATQNEMYTIFFGGIAQYYDSSSVLVQDNNCPFVKTIACVKREANGNMVEYKLPIEMPSLLGAGSDFFPINNLSYYANGVLKYDLLTADTTLVGYVFGGISSPVANAFNTNMMGNNGTSATNNLFKVYLIRTTSPVGTIQTSENAFQMQVYPNPSLGDIHINLNLKNQSDVNISILNTAGQLCYQQIWYGLGNGTHHKKIHMDKYNASGTYFVQLESEGKTSIQKIIVGH
jgi:hypothetical protein